MTTVSEALPQDDPHHLGVLAQVTLAGPPPKRIVTGYGFWIFLLSAMMVFSCFFAGCGVLSGESAGEPEGAQLLSLSSVAVEPRCLLLARFTCGIPSVAPED